MTAMDAEKVDVEKLCREALEQDKKATKWPWIPYRCQFVEKDDAWQIEKYGAELRACGINGEPWDHDRDQCNHPESAANVEWMCAARTREPILAREVLRLRAWLSVCRHETAAGVAHPYLADAALRGDPAPTQAEEPKS